MKIAVCISGQLRKLEENLISTAFKDYDVDYYIHTWDHDLNPNLKLVNNYFPNCLIDVEKYEDKFDNLFTQGIANENRYNYAQFYTILKSLHLCKNNGKKYDYYIRTRTDVDWPMHLWPDRVDKQLDLDTTAVISNTRISKHIPNLTFTSCDIPIVATGIAGVEFNTYLLRDWAWCMNQTAFNRITKYTPESLVNQAIKIKESYLKNQIHNTIQSPGIWGNLFESMGVIILNTSQFNTRLLRYYGEHKKYIEFYGDIS